MHDPFDPFDSFEPPESSAAADDPESSSPNKRQRPLRSLKARAIGYLSRREYSRAELARKLAPYAGEGEPLEPVLDALEQGGWLSNQRFAESLMHRRAPRMGTARIVGELKRHALDDSVLAEVGAQLRATEFARAEAVWRKKFGALPQTPAERMRQTRFLATRGFSHAVIGRLLKGGDDCFEETSDI
jgi:regulatory protein